MSKRLAGSIFVLFVLCVTGYLVLAHHEKSSLENKETLAAVKPAVKDLPVDAEKKAVSVSKIAESANTEEKKEAGLPAVASEDDGKWFEKAKQVIGGSDVNAKFAVLWGLGNRPVPEALELLKIFLDDENSNLVAEALDQLGSIGMRNEKLKEQVYKLLQEKANDSNFPRRGLALVTLAMFGKDDRTLTTIEEFITSNKGNEWMTLQAARALSFSAVPESVPILKQLLESSDKSEVKRNVMASLAAVSSPEAMGILEEYLLSGDEKNQALSAWALSMKNSSEFNQVLANAIVGQNLSSLALSSIAKSPASAEIFEKVFVNEEATEAKKLECLNLLTQETKTASPAVRSGILPVVAPLLDSKNHELEIASIEAIGAMGKKEAAELIEPKLSSVDTEVRKTALKSYPVHPDTYKPMLEMVWDSDQDISRTALSMCEILVNESDRQLLESVASSHDDELVRTTAQKIIDHYLYRPES